jgi:endoglucanase
MLRRQSLWKFFSSASKLLLIAILWLGGTYAFETINSLHIIPKKVTTDVSADGSVNIWWPTQNARISDTQAFKGMVQDKNISDYTMFWSVDGGQPNQMYDSFTDYPHKEAMVDLEGWNWHDAGPYRLTFRALDKGGNQLGESSIEIYTTLSGSPQNSTVVAGSDAAVPLAQPSVQPSVSSVTEIVTQGVTAAVTAALSPSSVQAQVVQKNIFVEWPTNNTTAKGTQALKARIEGSSIDSYKMYWAVDNGQKNEMSSEGQDKQAWVDFSGWTWRGNGPYSITFTAESLSGEPLGTQSVSVYSGSQAASTQINPQVQTAQSTVQNTVIESPQITQTQSNNSGNPFSGAKFYIDPNSDAKRTADSWRQSRPGDASQMDKIATQPETTWLGGWNSDVSSDTRNSVSAAQSQGAMPVFVVYNIPFRDCGQYSAGGVNNASEYHGWIQKIADAIGGNKAAVLIEPDALTLTSCLSGSQQSDRFSMIKDAVNTFKSKGNIAVYIDAGHPEWISADDMANRLTSAGVANANGFALNTSNFFATQSNIDYGTQISQKIGNKHFVIDTGRNGVGPTADRQWCNPSGRALGNRPTGNTGNSLVDAYLWVKGPGGSDGNCNGGPNAGAWWPDYALDIAKNSAF